MSFASETKKELVQIQSDDCCAKSELSALIRMNGVISLSSKGLVLDFATENAAIARRTLQLIKQLFDTEVDLLSRKKMQLKKNNVYILKVTKAREILDDLSLMDGLGFNIIPNRNILKSECCMRAYLAGAFLSCGSVNNPETSNYHLEMSFNEEEFAQFISKIMNDFELNAKMIKRRNKYVVYLKSSEKIGDFLRAIGASQSVMNFESTRIDRNMSNTVNRWNNCDIANEIKSMATANKQINDINTVDMFMGLDMLDEKTRIVALIRRKYPEMTLNELTEVYYEETGQTISKSGLHHRFKKISEEAKRLIQMENE